MSILVDPMTGDNLDTNIITHDRNLIIMVSSSFPSCYVMYHGTLLIDLRSVSPRVPLIEVLMIKNRGYWLLMVNIELSDRLKLIKNQMKILQA